MMMIIIYSKAAHDTATTRAQIDVLFISNI